MSDIDSSLLKHDHFFFDDFHNAYVEAKTKNYYEVLQLDGSEYRDILYDRSLRQSNKILSDSEIKALLIYAKSLARRNGGITPVNMRIAKENVSSFIYDLTNPSWESIKVTPKGFTVLQKPPVCFIRHRSHLPQVYPNQNGNIRPLSRYIQNMPKSDRLLFAVMLVACFVPEISHPIFVIESEKGSGKSTLTSLIKKLLDPSALSRTRLPKKVTDLIQILSKSYFVPFDNVREIPNDISDLLCMAVTGISTSSRKLFTDTDDILFHFRRCLLLNGLNLGALSDDLLDRSVLFELQRLSPDKIITDEDLKNSLARDKPDILGGIFNLVSEAMTIYPKLPAIQLPRLADFGKWGYSIAEAMGGRGDEFLLKLEDNSQKRNQQFIASNALASTIIVFMDNLHASAWAGTPTQLLSQLNATADKANIKRHNYNWPDILSLSKQLSSMQSNLKDAGIIYEKGKHKNNGSQIILRKS